MSPRQLLTISVATRWSRVVGGPLQNHLGRLKILSVTRFVTDIFAPLLWRVTVFTLAHHLILFGFDPHDLSKAAPVI